MPDSTCRDVVFRAIFDVKSGWFVGKGMKMTGTGPTRRQLIDKIDVLSDLPYTRGSKRFLTIGQRFVKPLYSCNNSKILPSIFVEGSSTQGAFVDDGIISFSVSYLN